MAVQSIKNRQYEDQQPVRGPLVVLMAIAMFGLAVLLMYVAIAEPGQNTLMGAIQEVMRGMGGDMRFALPLLFGWAGVMCVMMARGSRISTLKTIVDLLMAMDVFAMVQLFFAPRVVMERMTILGFANFVSKSYGYGRGGGAIGALLAWPMYRYLGVAGGFIAALLLLILCLAATGRLARMVDWFTEHFTVVEDDGIPSPAPRQARSAPRQRRPIERDPFDAGMPSEHPPRRRVNRDPFSEDVLGFAPAGRTRERPARPQRSQRPAREAVVGVPARKRSADISENMAAPRPVTMENTAAPRPMATENTAKPRQVTIENAATPRPVTMENTAPSRSREVVDVPMEQPRGRDRKLQVETVETPASPAERMTTTQVVEQRGRSGDVGFATGDFDDFDMLDAESILRDKQNADEGRIFKPDRSSAVEKTFQTRREAPPTPSVSKAEDTQRVEDIPEEDLRIEPVAYETPDREDIPFDIPSRQRVKKGELPKINHEEMKVTAEEDDPEYNYPPIDLLQSGEQEDVSRHSQKDREKAQLLVDTLQSFGITANLTGIAHGPAVTRFELQPAPGIKVSRITSLSDDIALNLAAMSVRIEAPIPGKAAVGVEIPNDKVEMVRLRDVLESQEARKHPSRIAVGLGKDNSGRYIVADIAKMPHVLIAGQTGSGKSVCINSIIASILFRASPEEVRLILIDPKVVELSIYNDIPHLVCPVVTDPKKAASALDWAVAEMGRRYKEFAARGVRDIKGYNKSLEEGEKIMPQMVIIIDELADLMMVSPGEVEDSICRLAQLARACGMHLVIATQRPSVNVITGIIKANIPTRIAFSVASQVDSRTMIDHGGAEKLLGNGDMLFVPNGMKSMRVQGAWVSDEEVHAIVEYIKQSGEAVYDPDMIEHLENATRSDAEKEDLSNEYDPKLPEAVDIVMDMGQASVSMLQRRMRIGYARAGRIIDEMAQRGIISEADGSKPRTVLISREQAQEMLDMAV